MVDFDPDDLYETGVSFVGNVPQNAKQWDVPLNLWLAATAKGLMASDKNWL